MAEVRYRVMAARPGVIDVRFRVNIGTRVIELTRTLEWDGHPEFDAFIQVQVSLAHLRLLQLADSIDLNPFVGRRGTLTPHVPPFPPPP